MQQSTERAASAALSIREFARQSGYSEANVRRAMRQLSITGQFQGRGKATLLEADDQRRIALQIDELELQGDPSTTLPGALAQPLGRPEGEAPEPRVEPSPPRPQSPELSFDLTYESPAQQSTPTPHSLMSTAPRTDRTLEISAGNHRQILENPTLPDHYDLAQFRSSETISTLADPGSIAAQAMGAIDALVHSMESDIQQQQAHLQETQRAAHTLRLKAKQLQDKKIEYMIQSSTLGQAQQQTTLELQEALEEIQSLGKSPSDAPKSPSSSR